MAIGIKHYPCLILPPVSFHMSLIAVKFPKWHAIWDKVCRHRVRWIGEEKVTFMTDSKYWHLKTVLPCCSTTEVLHWIVSYKHYNKRGKSDWFESCDWPIVRKRPIWVKIGDVLYRVTLKFDGWPWKTIGHLSFAVSSFVQHFIAIGAFKLELQSGNAQFGSNSTIFRAVWPWNLTDDLEKQ